MPLDAFEREYREQTGRAEILLAKKCRRGSSRNMWNRSENKINCIFIRHGCTVSNREHRYLGRTDEPLDEAGVFELKNALNNGVYKALEGNSLKEQIIITSPMRRCKQTAEINFAGRTAP
mgnify:FL=1